MLLAFTGWGRGEDRQRSHEACFDHHLTKPVDSLALKKTLAGESRAAAKAESAVALPLHEAEDASPFRLRNEGSVRFLPWI